jgi:hydrogenase nickel incorporation protein HypA/HybF
MGPAVHEMSLAEGVLGVIEDTLAVQPAGANETVRTVRLEIGRLAAVELEALRFSFEVVKRGTVADAATLEVIEVPGAAWCMQCCDSVPVAQRGDACPRCGSHQLQVTAGDELRVKDIELAAAPAVAGAE